MLKKHVLKLFKAAIYKPSIKPMTVILGKAKEENHVR
jgi:hypothetical protein